MNLDDDDDEARDLREIYSKSSGDGIGAIATLMVRQNRILEKNHKEHQKMLTSVDARLKILEDRKKQFDLLLGLFWRIILYGAMIFGFFASIVPQYLPIFFPKKNGP